MHPVAYQFDVAAPGSGGRDWDANWLLIQGEVGTADHRQWVFLDPCLTTWEARDLGAWLREAATGNVQPGRRSLVFTEPNLAFCVEEHDGGRASVRIRFAHEALPAWMPRDHPHWQAGEYVLVLELAGRDLAQAADTWDRECMPFPER